MVGIGLLLIATSLLAFYMQAKNLFAKVGWFLKILPFTIILPYIANTTGWILTESGREPWVVYGLLTMKEGVSKSVSSGMLITSLVGFILVYGLLIAATLYLMFKFAKACPAQSATTPLVEEISPLLGETRADGIGGGK
jgi:cytochrome d ubiquinol oxidase subunit I